MSVSRIKKRSITRRNVVEKKLALSEGMYRITGDFGYTCRGEDRYPESIAIKSGVVLVQKNTTIFAVGDAPKIEYLSIANNVDTFDALRLMGWYSWALQGDATARIDAMLGILAAKIGMTSADGVVVQITKSHLGILARVSREMVGRILTREDRYDPCRGISYGILIKGERNDKQTFNHMGGGNNFAGLRDVGAGRA